jgi:hypothetical protein
LCGPSSPSLGFVAWISVPALGTKSGSAGL